MDLVVFENNKPYIIDEFREGRFDYIELAAAVEEVVHRLIAAFSSHGTKTGTQTATDVGRPTGRGSGIRDT